MQLIKLLRMHEGFCRVETICDEFIKDAFVCLQIGRIFSA